MPNIDVALDMEANCIPAVRWMTETGHKITYTVAITGNQVALINMIVATANVLAALIKRALEYSTTLMRIARRE